MPLYGFRCPKCETTHEEIAKMDQEVRCPACDAVTEKTPGNIKSYKIKGDNSASITPKKFRV